MNKWFYLISVFAFLSCKDNKTEDPVFPDFDYPADTESAGENYFPVTDYILGQISEIRTTGINPMRITGNDTVWIKVEDLEKEFSDFLDPVIDNSNMIETYKESRFLDQTLNSYTLLYEPREPGKEQRLQEWVVYVDPDKGTVRRIYIRKNEKGKTQLLNWEGNKWCKVTVIKNDSTNGSTVESEILIKWDY